jgi:hypothetical protein
MIRYNIIGRKTKAARSHDGRYYPVCQTLGQGNHLRETPVPDPFFEGTFTGGLGTAEPAPKGL